jgi:hypothetical protein
MEPDVAAPMVKPLNVTVNAADALMVAADVRSTMDVAPVEVQSSLKPGMLLVPSTTTGVTEGAKKLGGYVRVIEPGAPIDDSGVNDKVTDTLALVATRSAEEIFKNAFWGRETMGICSPCSVCNGLPEESNVDTLPSAVSAKFVVGIEVIKPETWHRIGESACNGVALDSRSSTKTPEADE